MFDLHDFHFQIMHCIVLYYIITPQKKQQQTNTHTKTHKTSPQNPQKQQQ